jgi:hypothetical protein
MKAFKYTFFPAPIKSINSQTGAITFELDGVKHIHYLLSTCEVWAPAEGIKVQKGDKVTIRASGRYHPAIHHLVEYGKEDINLELPWTDPRGIPSEKIKDGKHKNRALLRLDTLALFGELIAKFTPEGLATSKTIGPKETPYYNNKHFINGSEPISIKEDGELRFAVNEPYILNNNRFKDAYIYKEDTDKKGIEDRKEKWDIIVKNSDWELWFKDNIGFILIIIEIEHN